MQIIDKRNQLGRILREFRKYMNGMACGLNDRDYEAINIHYGEAERHIKLVDAIREKARAAEPVEAKPEQHTTGTLQNGNTTS